MATTIDLSSDVVLSCEDDVFTHISGICFKKGPPERVGVEVEWVVVPRHDPAAHFSLDDVSAHLATLDLPGGSSLTFEPGGQLELSSVAQTDPSALVRDLDLDLAQVLSGLADLDLALSDRAYDGERTARRQLSSPRYDAMETYFSLTDPDLGPQMMCRCAGLQVNLDCGETAAEIARRWRLLHAMGPALTAAFANSPARGWRSRRQGVWQHLDPARTGVPLGADPVTAWTSYALAAPVMMIRESDGWQPRPGLTFGEWVAGGHGLRPPTLADLEYHLTTLFPPVRPRAWFEVRYLDAQPRAWWAVPALVMWALMSDIDATETALAPHDTADLWLAAAHDGLADERLAKSAIALFDAALPLLAALDVDDVHTRQVEIFADRFVRRGLSPADDIGFGRW